MSVISQHISISWVPPLPHVPACRACRMGKNDWHYVDPGRWEAPEDTSVSAGTPGWFHLRGVTTRPARAHKDLELAPAAAQQHKRYGARGNDGQLAAGGRPNAPPGWFEPPEDTTVSAETPSWFWVPEVGRQAHLPPRGRGSRGLERQPHDDARLGTEYRTELGDTMGYQPNTLEPPAPQPPGPPGDTPADRFTSMARVVGTTGNIAATVPFAPKDMKAPGVLDVHGFRAGDLSTFEVRQGATPPVAEARREQEAVAAEQRRQRRRESKPVRPKRLVATQQQVRREAGQVEQQRRKSMEMEFDRRCIQAQFREQFLQRRRSSPMNRRQVIR
jgi:hypothetical protein